MNLPAYDILKKQKSDFVWMESARELEAAKKRITELSGHGRKDTQFVVFDQRTMQVVASSSQT
jgi:hypothetical protein